MTNAPRTLKETPSQTAGPYLHIGLTPAATGLEISDRQLGTDIAGPHANGTRIRIEGLILDGTGTPMTDALLEIWQANGEGIYAHPDDGRPVEDGFRGWGRVTTDFETGEWGFDTIKPGQSRGPDGGLQAPHINAWVVARGINLGLHTRIYFDDEPQANATDPVLNLIEDERRQKTLIAKRTDRAGQVVYRFDIRLQSEDETVFFDI